MKTWKVTYIESLDTVRTMILQANNLQDLYSYNLNNNGTLNGCTVISIIMES